MPKLIAINRKIIISKAVKDNTTVLHMFLGLATAKIIVSTKPTNNIVLIVVDE